MKKRILSIVLAICLVLSCVPITVFAANTDATELQNKLNSGGTVMLDKDYTIDSTLNVDRTVTLDLNGHVIKMTGSGTVIIIGGQASLTMIDSNKTATHTDSTLPAGGVITGGNATQNGGGVYVGDGCSMTMTGGTIENCSATGGGGLYVFSSGSFTMEGGTIENCSATYGGGVYVSKSTFAMEGGTIENCSAKSGGGGGIYVSSGTFTMGDGEIKNCKSSFGGGGLCIVASGSGSLSTFTMTGGIIENCTSKNVSESAAIFAGNSNILANGGIVKGMVSLQPSSTVQATSSNSYTRFYDRVTNKGTISSGVYYGGVQDSSGTVSGTYHTVSFDSNGGIGSVPTQWFVNTDKAPALQPADPTKDGYQAFDGWYNGDTRYDFSQPVTQDITLTAKFSNPKTYNISYDLDGGTATNPATYNVESDAITLNNPTKTGYTFTGWSGTGLTGVNNMTVTIAKGSTGDRTYTAHFSQNNYTVKFDTNGGSSISDKTGVKWTDTVLDGITAPTKDGWEFTGWKCGDMTVNANTKYSDLVANDTVKSVTLVAQWKDITAPTGEISVGTNKWNGFLNTITFGLFFKDTQSVTITASDNSGEDVTIEYLLSDKGLNKTDLASKEFTEYGSAFNINPDNKYVVYARLTDHAGNVTYISSNGIVLDATAPAITGVTDGSICYTTQKAVVADENLESVTLNGVSVDGTIVTLDGNKDAVYTIVATDKSGNITTFTVTMKPISSLAESIDGVNGENVNSSNKDTIEAVKESVGEVDTSNATDSEKEALSGIDEICNELLDIIDKAQEAIETENIKNAEEISPDNVTKDDREALDNAKADFEKAIEDYGSNYTDDETANIELDLERIDESLKVLDDVKAVEDLIAELPKSVEPDDLDTVQSILDASDAYNALTDYEKSLVSKDAKEKLYTLTAGISAYMVYEGNGGLWTIGQSGALTFTANGAYSKFTGIKIDGVLVDAKYYTAKSGSTIISLNADYLNTLSAGAHTLTVLYTDGEAEAEFEVVKQAEAETEKPNNKNKNTSKQSPETGNDINSAMWLMLLLSCGGVIVVTGAYGKRKKQSR